MSEINPASKIRNVAIIAHVDHGKTTLVDALLRQSGMYRTNESLPERAMDSMDLEKERGITISAKNCSLQWDDLTINIVDTPGHSDFGGEVERILSMVDGALLLVDAAEGPLPQTRFVLRKALEANLSIMVIINKIDRADQRTVEVEDEIFALFIDCDADDRHLECPVIYAIARDGKATTSLAHIPTDMSPIFEAIRDFIPPPPVELDKPLSILISNLDYSDYVGRLAIGRIKSGNIKVNDQVLVAGETSSAKAKVSRLYKYAGLKRVECESAIAGDIVAIAGIEVITIGDTITDPASPQIQPRIVVEEPTVSMLFGPNTSPFTGREGTYVTARNIKERLAKEMLRNVSLRITDGGSPDKTIVAGRGELQLAILIEQMRREGFELEVSRPTVIERQIDGVWCEPFENPVIDVQDTFIGIITEMLSSRRGILVSMGNAGAGRVRMEFTIPSRGLIGIRSTLLTATRGTGIMHSVFDSYKPRAGEISGRVNGAMISDRIAPTTAYALENLEPRGRLFVGDGVDVYGGMIVGEHAKDNDIEVYAGRPKKLSNMRSSGTDIAVTLTPPITHTLETAMEWIADDELIEVTPKSIRLRKRTLDPNKRKTENR